MFILRGFESVAENNLSALVHFLRTSQPERLARVCTYKSGTIIHAGASVSIPCRVEGCIVDQRKTVVFEPNVHSNCALLN